MFKRRRTVVLVSLLGFSVAVGCSNFNYNCAGICGLVPGDGDFEGVISADSLSSALAQCGQLSGCDAGTTSNCTCTLQE